MEPSTTPQVSASVCLNQDRIDKTPLPYTVRMRA